MQVSDIRSLSVFDGLTDEQLGELVAAGAQVMIEPGVEVFHEGDHADFWWVLIEGALDLYRHIGREDTRVGRMDVPGRWAGGFRAWDEHGVYLATGRGVIAGCLLQVPAPALRSLCDAWFPFGGHLIEGLYGTARTIESTARQRESLVTLGTLAAGVAHEINNPAAAATRAVDALETACQALLSSLDRLAESVAPKLPGRCPSESCKSINEIAAVNGPAGGLPLPSTSESASIDNSALAGSCRSRAARTVDGLAGSRGDACTRTRLKVGPTNGRNTMRDTSA